MKSFRLRMLAQTLPFLLIAPGLALAQHAPTRGEATAALNQPAKPGAQQYTRQQIDQLVAPIALYPDQLLSQVLMAATYPDQVVQASQWLQDPGNKDIKGDALAQALESMPWDPSVKALCAFPQVIQMMAEHIEWTEALGVAFATQQREVMARVQALRHLAMKSGRLAKVKHLKVQEEGQVVVITEAEPGRIFVPVYNPTVVYGQWPDQEFPPVFIPPPQGFVSETIEPGLEVSVAYTAVRPLWGWSRVDWRDERITVDRTEYTRITRNVEVGPGDTWRHMGPVVLVAPTSVSRTTTVTTNVPAGTVAPARAAAVTVLPQRAAADPAQIKTQTTTTETRTTEPGRAQTTTTQPNATQPSQGAATQPSTAQPGAARSGTSEPEQNKAGTGQPSTATTNPPSATAPEHKAPTTQSGSAEPGKTGAGRNQAATGQTEQPGKPEAAQARPGEHQARPSEANRLNREKEAKPSETSGNRQQERANMPAGSQPQPGAQERAGSSKLPNPAEQERMRGPERNGAATMPGQHEERARTPEQGGSSMQPAEHNPAGRERGAEKPAAGAQAPGAAAPVQQHQNRPGPEAGQGSSTPPAATPHAQPSAQKPQQPAEHAGRPEQKEQNEKKER